MKRLTFAFCFLALSACATAPFPGHEEYRENIELRSAGDKKFSGLYDNFEFRATLLTKDILRRINEREALIYGWSAESTSEELNKKMTKAQKQTRLFVSFFTPRAKDDNLSKSSTIWKIYLHTGGKRYEGRASHTNYNIHEAQAIYPYHNRWGTTYHFDFPMSSDVVDGGQARLEITGPLGRKEVSFQ